MQTYLYSSVLSPERAAPFSSHTRSGRSERSDGGAPGCAVPVRACFPRKSSPSGNPLPPHHPLYREGNLCETRTPRPVRHRGKHEVIDGDIRPTLAHSFSHSSRESTNIALICAANTCKSRVSIFFFLLFFFFFFLALPNSSEVLPRARIILRKDADHQLRVRS